MNFTPEQVAKAKTAKSIEELLTCSSEIGLRLSEDEAKYYFEQWNKQGELSDEELDNVTGGATCIERHFYSDDPPYWMITTCYNRCPLFAVRDNSLYFETKECWNCKNKNGDFPMFCTARTKDNDPYR